MLGAFYRKKSTEVKPRLKQLLSLEQDDSGMPIFTKDKLYASEKDSKDKRVAPICRRNSLQTLWAICFVRHSSNIQPEC